MFKYITYIYMQNTYKKISFVKNLNETKTMDKYNYTAYVSWCTCKLHITRVYMYLFPFVSILINVSHFACTQSFINFLKITETESPMQRNTKKQLPDFKKLVSTSWFSISLVTFIKRLWNPDLRLSIVCQLFIYLKMLNKC